MQILTTSASGTASGSYGLLCDQRLCVTRSASLWHWGNLGQVITKFCSERIAKYAFEYAYLNNRKTVTAVHKANIMKLADGLFLESCREVAKKYPVIKYNEVIVDNCCMQLVSKPQQFDVMVMAMTFSHALNFSLTVSALMFLICVVLHPSPILSMLDN